MEVNRVKPMTNEEISKWRDHFINLFKRECFKNMSASEKAEYLTPSDANDGMLDFSRNVLDQPLSDDLKESVADNFDIVETRVCMIGQGTFGRVYKLTLESGRVVAVKQIPKIISVKGSPHFDNRPNIAKEIVCMQTLADVNHAVKLIMYHESEKEISIVMPYLPGGNLLQRLRRVSRFSEQEAAKICCRIALFLHKCHAKGIVHRDLKLDNIFLNSEESNIDVYVGDFGLASFFSPGEKLTERVGTLPYISPNALRENYGPETDLWSLGVILHYLLIGDHPFVGRTNEEVMLNILTAGVSFSSREWLTISNEAKDLVQGLLCKDERFRLTPQQVMVHPWILKNLVGI